MFCSKCGTKVSDDDYACYMCGARLNNNVRSALDILREEEEREAEEAARRAEGLKQAWQQDTGAKEESENADLSEEYSESDDPIEATVREMFQNEASSFESENNEDIEYMHSLIGESDKKASYEGKSRTTIIVSVAAALLVAVAVGLYIWLTRPAKVIEEAVQTEDIQTVSELYEKIPDEEQKEEIKVSMIGRARELRDQFLNEEISYEEVKAEFDLLKDNVFDDSEEFNEMSEQIDRIDASRRAFNKAERSYERGKYPDAIEDYKEVIEEDEEYYARAQEGIVKCNEAVHELIMGVWSYEYDARKEVQQYVKEKGFDIDLSKMKIPICFLFDIKEDGSIEVSVDYDALNEYIDKVLDLAVETMSKSATEAIPGNVDFTNLLKGMYNASGVKDDIKEKLNIQGALDNLLKDAGVDKIDSYRIEDGHLYIGTACMDVSVEDTIMTLTSDDSEALAVGYYKMPYPIKMELVEKKAESDTTDIEEENKNSETDNMETDDRTTSEDKIRPVNRSEDKKGK